MILVACEESQAVTIAFRSLGYEAVSCDTQECSGGHPEWHIRCDVTKILWEPWDAIIAFPPCTYLTAVANRWFDESRYGEAAVERKRKRIDAVNFVMKIWDSCDRVAIENPTGYLSSMWRRPAQTIHPYFFGDPESKRTCLWLKNFPNLKRTHFDTKPKIHGHFKTGRRKGQPIYFHESNGRLDASERSKIRSKTFPGVAREMAEQWGPWIESGSMAERQLRLFQ
jgi:hypothetical protein